MFLKIKIKKKEKYSPSSEVQLWEMRSWVNVVLPCWICVGKLIRIKFSFRVFMRFNGLNAYVVFQILACHFLEQLLYLHNYSASAWSIDVYQLVIMLTLLPKFLFYTRNLRNIYPIMIPHTSIMINFVNAFQNMISNLSGHIKYMRRCL